MKQNEYVSVFQFYFCKLHIPHWHKTTSIWNYSSFQIVDMVDLKTPTQTQNHTLALTVRAVFTHGPKGPRPRAANFQGWHIKKNNWDWSMVCGKKRLSTREKFKGDLYWKHYVLSFVSFLCCLCLHITEYEQIRGGGGTKFSWAQGRKIPKYGPAYSNRISFFFIILSNIKW
jgi:hypothetical protein